MMKRLALFRFTLRNTRTMRRRPMKLRRKFVLPRWRRVLLSVVVPFIGRCWRRRFAILLKKLRKRTRPLRRLSRFLMVIVPRPLSFLIRSITVLMVARIVFTTRKTNILFVKSRFRRRLRLRLLFRRTRVINVRLLRWGRIWRIILPSILRSALILLIVPIIKTVTLAVLMRILLLLWRRTIVDRKRWVLVFILRLRKFTTKRVIRSLTSLV